MPAPPAKVGDEARQEATAWGQGTAYMCHSQVCDCGHELESFGLIQGKNRKKKKKKLGSFLPPSVFLEEALETGRQWENREALSHQGVGSHLGTLNPGRAALWPETPTAATALGCFKASSEVAARP